MALIDLTFTRDPNEADGSRYLLDTNTGKRFYEELPIAVPPFANPALNGAVSEYLAAKKIRENGA